MNAQEILGKIDAAHDAVLTEKRGQKWNPKNLYASGFHPCVRKHVLSFTESINLPGFDTDTLAKFKRGEDRERDILLDAAKIGQRAGFTVGGGQERIEIKDESGNVLITGKMDSVLYFGKECVPVEVKSWMQMVVDKLDNWRDFFNYWWTRKAAYQLAVYLHAKQAEFGYFILDNAGGKYKWIPFYLSDMEFYFNEFRGVAKSAIDHKLAGTLPDFHSDLSECKHCEFFGGVCQPPSESKEAQIILDAELGVMIDRYVELKPQGEEFEALDKILKEKLRGCENGITQKAIISGKWRSMTKYNLPEEIKSSIDEMKKPYAMKDPKGAFILRIEAI
jgi:hypothetical protein